MKSTSHLSCFCVFAPKVSLYLKLKNTFRVFLLRWYTLTFHSDIDLSWINGTIQVLLWCPLYTLCPFPPQLCQECKMCCESDVISTWCNNSTALLLHHASLHLSRLMKASWRTWPSWTDTKYYPVIILSYSICWEIQLKATHWTFELTFFCHLQGLELTSPLNYILLFCQQYGEMTWSFFKNCWKGCQMILLSKVTYHNLKDTHNKGLIIADRRVCKAKNHHQN